jgi:phenylacetyl-CoA:acceptor oxidoreductase subunit 1
MVACPYQMRSMYEDPKKEYFPGQGLTEHEQIGRTLYPHEPGVVQKCVFCKERIDAGLAAGLKPKTATPAQPVQSSARLKLSTSAIWTIPIATL